MAKNGLRKVREIQEVLDRILQARATEASREYTALRVKVWDKTRAPFVVAYNKLAKDFPHHLSPVTKVRDIGHPIDLTYDHAAHCSVSASAEALDERLGKLRNRLVRLETMRREIDNGRSISHC